MFRLAGQNGPAGGQNSQMWSKVVKIGVILGRYGTSRSVGGVKMDQFGGHFGAYFGGILGPVVTKLVCPRHFKVIF